MKRRNMKIKCAREGGEKLESPSSEGGNWCSGVLKSDSPCPLFVKTTVFKEFPRTGFAWMLLRHQGNKQLSLAPATSFVSWHLYHLSNLQIVGHIPEAHYSSLPPLISMYAALTPVHIDYGPQHPGS